jgi:hypothetical protein
MSDQTAPFFLFDRPTTGFLSNKVRTYVLLGDIMLMGSVSQILWQFERELGILRNQSCSNKG